MQHDHHVITWRYLEEVEAHERACERRDANTILVILAVLAYPLIKIIFGG